MHPWLADRTSRFDSSGIRKVFDLAAKLDDPINLSIGQPDFPAPQAVKQAAIDAILADKNGYSLTQGMPALVERLQADVNELGHADRKVLVTNGASGALVLAMLALIDPGDEVICFDPYFVMYPTLCGMVGGRAVMVDTYPSKPGEPFRIDPERVSAAITPKTKAIVLGSPGNPTGQVASDEEVRCLAELAAERGIALVSDEIYSRFVYDSPLVSPTRWNDQAIVIDAFSKSHALTGWRLGYVHGPAEIIEKMTMLQQYTFVCAPHPLQCGALAAAGVDMSDQVTEYGRRRNRLVTGLREAGYKTANPGGAFYAFPQAPPAYESATDFVTRAVEHDLLIIPGGIFSNRDTHFRVSFAASEETIDRGLEVLAAMAS